MAAAAAPNLDQGPPLPPNLQPAPQPTVAGLAGQQPQQGSASLQQQVIQKLMFVEQTLTDIATIMPAAAGPVNGLIDQMRKGMGAVLAQGATPPQPQGVNAMLMAGTGGAPTS
jgi:hypothetical protein